MKKESNDHIQNILSNLPKSPGVYQMKDKAGKVMYVGKAKSLKSRVNSYFVKATDLSLAKRQMVGKIADIEIITCSTEVEALVLETNLIKHLTPKYNILMKDDKNLAYIKITNAVVPELIKTRQKFRDGGEYFGPYVSAVEQSVRALRRIFRIRDCRVKFQPHPLVPSPPEKGDGTRSPSPLGEGRGEVIITDKAGKTIPCMDYYIGICPAPCLLDSEKIEKHNSNIDNVRLFLSGESSGFFDQLEAQMREKAALFDFEEAQKIKEMITALRGLAERQRVRDVVEGNIDIFMKYEKYDKTYIGLTQIRSSQIVGVFRHEVNGGIDDDVLVQFLTRQYLDGEDIPDLLLVREDVSDDSFLEFLRSQKIDVEYPKIGPKNDLLDFTLTQLREYAYKRELATLENKTLTREHMAHVLEKLGYNVPEKGEIIFECYDISHTDGHFTYASRVLISNGKPDPSRYKKYKIKSLADGDIDDFASHREVMMRRTIEGIELGNFPHLIIIDGGKGQLSSALAGVQEGKWKSENELLDPSSRAERGDPVTKNDSYFISGLLRSSQGQENLFPICSIAKREEEIFIPSTKDSILFDKGTPELMVLQKARDESHRFSITANKTARMKSMKKNILEEIPGIGPVTRKKLLKIAGDVSEIKNMKLEVIEKICTKAQIETLRDHGIIFS